VSASENEVSVLTVNTVNIIILRGKLVCFWFNVEEGEIKGTLNNDFGMY